MDLCGFPNCGYKDLGPCVIYKDTAKYMGILDKLENNDWFKACRVTLKDGSQIEYFKVNYNEGRYPWKKENEYISFEDIIKGYIKEVNNNILFTYNQKDFNNCMESIKRYAIDSLEDASEDMIEYAKELIDSFKDVDPREITNKQIEEFMD